jgi:hypothetical protein
LNGDRVWSHFTGQTGIGEHGTHSTPLHKGNHFAHIAVPTLFCYEISDVNNASELYAHALRLPSPDGNSLQSEFLGKAPWKGLSLLATGSTSTPKHRPTLSAGCCTHSNYLPQLLPSSRRKDRFGFGDQRLVRRVPVCGFDVRRFFDRH